MPDLMAAKRKHDRQKQIAAIKAQFGIVQQHIAAGDLRQARKELAFFDNHPNAKVAERAAQLAHILDGKEKIKRAQNDRRLLIGMGVTFAVLVVAIVGMVIAINSKIPTTALEMAWEEMCIDFAGQAVYRSFDDLPSAAFNAYMNECHRQAEVTVRFEPENVWHCYNESDNARLDSEFRQCAMRNNVWVNGDDLTDAIIDAMR